MRRAGSTWAVIAFVTVVGVALAAPSFASALSLQPTSQGLLPASKAVSGIAAGDFNGDGADDLAVAEEGGVIVWLSNGDGTFTKGETLSDGLSDNTAVVVGDFNGDGKLDLAYSYAFGRVAIALGNGNGTFQPPVQVAESPSLPFYIRDHQLAVGDFEGNGRDEIVVVGSFTNLTVEEGEYQVIADEGGAFTAKSPVNFPIAAESEVVGVAVGDYNDDGDQDLAVLGKASNVTNYTRDSIYGEVGQGNDTFVPTANPISLAFASYALPWTETTANLNGSGGDDLLISTATNNGMIPLLGSSTEFLAPDPGGTPQGFIESFGAPAAADLTGDGLDDAISGFARGEASGVNGGLDIALADGSGGLTTAAGSPLRSGLEDFDPGDVVSGDFNGDGTPDIAVASIVTDVVRPHGVVVLINSPQLESSTEELEFGDVEVGESATLPVTLTGLGGPAAEVSNIEIAGGPAGPFSVVDPSACATVAYEEECELEVEFAPTSYDEATDTLDFTSDTGTDGADVVSSVELTGAGIGTDAGLSPATDDFGAGQIGGAPVTKSLTIESLGSEPLAVSNVSLSSEADFKLVDPSACVRSLAAGSSCEVGVSFDPAAGAAGVRSATLTVETDGGTRTAQLSGTANAAPSNGNGGADNGNGNAGDNGNGAGGEAGSGAGAGSSGGGSAASAGKATPTGSLKLKAPGSVMPGKSAKVKVVLKNTGSTGISGLALTTNVPKTYATAPKPLKVAALAAGKTVTETIVVKIKKNAPKGMKLALVVEASAGGKALATAHGGLKVK